MIRISISLRTSESMSAMFRWHGDVWGTVILPTLGTPQVTGATSLYAN